MELAGLGEGVWLMELTITMMGWEEVNVGVEQWLME